MCGREQTDETFAMLPHYGISAGARLGGLVGGTVGYVERLIGAALFLQEALVSYEIRRHGIVPLGPWLEREHIAAFVTVPTVLRHLLSTLAPEQLFPDLRTVVLGGAFFALAVALRRDPSPRRAMKLFGYSITYLTVLFVAMAGDVLISNHIH